jgi:GT2 family glycosyltransferase
VDFCLRLIEAGYRNVYTPYAGGTHYESKSRGYDTAGANLERFNREKHAFVTRHAAIMENGDPCYNPHFTYLYENYGYK